MGASDIELARALDDAAEVACAVNPVVATTAEKHGLPGGGLLRFRPTGDSQVIVSQELQATDLCRGSAHHYLGYLTNHNEPITIRIDHCEARRVLGGFLNTSTHNLTSGFAHFVAIGILGSFATVVVAQTPQNDRPVPILTGNAGYFTTVDAARYELVPEVNPVLLLPLGDKWLVESRGRFYGEFERPANNQPYGGKIEKDLNYLQADYIADPHLTVTVGRFLTPFGIYNERLYPIWIRDLHQVPLIFPLESGSSDGIMLRGGFPLASWANLNYATYYSTLTTNETLASDRAIGARAGMFFSRPRIEVGSSLKKLLMEGRNNSFGFHFAWQPPPIPLNLRAEYARSNYGSGYWIEGAYRFSQIPLWNKAMRRTEFVGRMQQFFAGEDQESEGDQYTLPHGATQQPDFGMNYYLKDGLKASASYGRWLGKHNWNVWTFGVAWRFAVPLGRVTD